MNQQPRVVILNAGKSSAGPLAFPADTVDVALDAPFDDEAFAVLSSLHPDVVLLDLRSRFGSTSAAISRVRRAFASARIVVVGPAGDQAMAEAAFAAGTSGFVSRDAAPEDLLLAVRGAMRGRMDLSRTATNAILRLAGMPNPEGDNTPNS